MPRHSKRPGYGQGKRGRHKRRFSKETEVYEKELAPPERPPWMSQKAYEGLLRIREGS